MKPFPTPLSLPSRTPTAGIFIELKGTHRFIGLRYLRVASFPTSHLSLKAFCNKPGTEGVKHEDIIHKYHAVLVSALLTLTQVQMQAS